MNPLRLVVLALPLLSGCAAIIRNGEPDGFQRSLAEVRQKQQADRIGLIGSVPWDLLPAEKTYSAFGIPTPDFDAIEQRKTMGYLSSSESEICFILFERLEWNDVGNLREEEKPDFIASRRKRMESGAFVLELFDSLVDVPTRPVLPASGGTPLTVRKAEMGIDVETRRFRVPGSSRERVKKYNHEEMMYELCGPAPTLSASTRYLTVSQKFREATLNETYTHFLYVFARLHEGEEPTLDARGSDGTPAPTTSAPSTSTREPAPATTAAPAATPSKAQSKPRSSQLMSIEQSVIAPGTAFVVTFRQPMKAAPQEKYWLTIVHADADTNAYTSYSYLDPDMSSVQLSSPSVAGTYEVRLHGNYPTKTYNLIDRLRFKASTNTAETVEDSPVVAPLPEDKGAKSKLMSVAKARLVRGERFTVTFPKALKAKPNEKYWVAIAAVGAKDTEYVNYVIIKPGMTSANLSTPDQPGEYEVRLHGNYPKKASNVVDRLKVTVP